MEAETEAGEVALLDRGTHLRHQRLVIEQVVDGVQPRTENLADAMQMMQVGTSEIMAGVAGAVGLGGSVLEPTSVGAAERKAQS